MLCNNKQQCKQLHKSAQNFQAIFFLFLFFVSECTLLLLELFFGKNHVANVQKEKKKHPQATIFSVIRSSSNLLILSKLGSESSYKDAERS
jgi:hypothetical protein